MDFDPGWYDSFYFPLTQKAHFVAPKHASSIIETAHLHVHV